MSSRLPRALPFLDHRHSTMLADMGVAPWWAPRALLPWPTPARDDTPLADPAAVMRLPHVATTPQPAPSPARTLGTQAIVTPADHTANAPSLASKARPDPIAAAAPAGHGGADAGALPADTMGTLDWEALHAAIHACQRCALARCRTRAVPGVGDRQADWLIIGEAPGEEEDRQGEPFVGRAGQLLDRMLAALDLQRGQRVYIANVLKCRPPRNRNPEPEEIAHCTPYLLRQIALLRPRLILAMGRFAAQTLLAEGGCMPPEALLRVPLGRLRGQVYRGRYTTDDAVLEVPIVVTYHPAYLLRNPADKGKAWVDLCLAAETEAPSVRQDG